VTVTALPIWLVDILGAVAMMILAALCILHVRQLRRRDPQNLIWTYLAWVCYCLAGFAVSRSAGHILKQVLIIMEYGDVWKVVQPYSGSINTFLLIIVSAITLFFSRVWRVYLQIADDRTALQKTHRELVDLNETLEKRVEKRTEALALSEKQIAQADKLASIGQLSSGVAHEINNPLGIILGYTQLLLRNEAEGTQQYDDLKIIEKNVKSCKNIVENLLNFARSAPSKRDQVDIHGIIEEVLAFMRHQPGMNAMSVETQFNADLPHAVLDEKKIKQVLINLLMNAQHASGGSGSIQIETGYEAREERLSIAVRDDGCGIDPRNIPRIFDPFFTTKPTGEGTGLGLAVSYGIVKSHGGNITVSSEPGRGSVFTIHLPVSSGGGRIAE